MGLVWAWSFESLDLFRQLLLLGLESPFHFLYILRRRQSLGHDAAIH